MVQIAIRPHVHDLVELARFRLPDPHVGGILLADRHDRLEVAQPLPRLAHLRAIPAELVEMAGLDGRLEGKLDGQDLVLLGLEHGPDLRDVALGPLVVLRQLAPQPIPLVEAGIVPEMDELVQEAELGRPRALELPVLVAPDLPADLLVQLQVLALLARHQRVGAQLVDHGLLLSLWLSVPPRRGSVGAVPAKSRPSQAAEKGPSAAMSACAKRPNRSARIIHHLTNHKTAPSGAASHLDIF